ncbi:carboxypeptidase Y-deficient [Coemansia sp. RSA 2424]|nr:carboxypeptidase Y-deficient [Coemansia sp. RSA 2424]
MHLDEMHFTEESTMKAAGMRTTTAAQQDDLDDVKGAILGFFRGAGKAVRGLSGGGGGVGGSELPEGGPAVVASGPRVGGGRRRVVEDGPGVVRSLTTVFVHLRRTAVSAARLEDNRVERRVERLVLAHQGGAGRTAGEVQAAEQRVVAWEPDDAHDACPLCTRRFGRLAVRRHHCRICGRLVCGTCTQQLHSATAGAELRICLDCSRTVARIRTRHELRSAAASDGGPLEKLYEDIRAGMADADGMLPKFNAMLGKVRGGGGGQGEAARAAAMRRKLTAAFGCADRASKAVAALPADSPSAARLHAAVRRAVVQYLQTHMFTLSMLPSSKASTVSLPVTPVSGSRETSIDQPPTTAPTADSLPPPPLPTSSSTTTNSSVASGFAASILSYVIAPRSAPPIDHQAPPTSLDVLVQRALDADPLKQARLAEQPMEEKLASLEVLRDQRQRVLGYISEAQKERRLEDAISLQSSLSDLEVELSIIERNL